MFETFSGKGSLQAGIAGTDGNARSPGDKLKRFAEEPACQVSVKHSDAKKTFCRWCKREEINMQEAVSPSPVTRSHL